eukprot:5758204-Pyramimonas_sp.AAC.1
MDGQTLFQAAGATLQAFSTDDERGVVRSPDTARTLGLRNTDMKVISATLNAAFSPIAQQTTSKTQRGFIAGRQFTSNILELESLPFILGRRISSRSWWRSTSAKHFPV